MSEVIQPAVSDEVGKYMAERESDSKGKRMGNPFNHNPKPEMLTSTEKPDWLPVECESLKEYVYAWLLRKFLEPLEITTQKEATELIKEAMAFKDTYLQRQAANSSADMLAKIESNPALMALLKAKLGAK